MNAPAREDETHQPTDLLACQIITYEPDPDGRLDIIDTTARLGHMVSEGLVIICNLSMSWLIADSSPDNDAWMNLGLTIGHLRKLGARVIINMTHYRAPFHAQVFKMIPEAFTLHGRDPNKDAPLQIFWIDTHARDILEFEVDAPTLILLNDGQIMGTSDHDKPYDPQPFLEHFQEQHAA